MIDLTDEILYDDDHEVLASLYLDERIELDMPTRVKFDVPFVHSKKRNPDVQLQSTDNQSENRFI